MEVMMNRADFEGLVEETTDALSSRLQRDDVFRLESDETDQLSAALAQAQSKMTAIKQSGSNPHFRSKYSNMVDVRSSVTLPCSEFGLSITIQPLLMNGEWVARGVLRHKSGQWAAGFLPLMLGKRDMQAMKSAMTYAQRTLTIALTGAASGEDDDGNDAVATPTPEASKADRTTTALAMMKDVIASGSEDESRKMLAKIKLRESEKGLTKGTGSKAQAMFDEAFNQGA